MWNGKYKALTFSYDDGQTPDLKMIEILNKYNLKCTFNISSGLGIKEGEPDYRNETNSGYLTVNEIKKYLVGHEIAGHSCTHPGLTDCSFDDAFREVYEDKLVLEKTFNTKIYGMAYPFGTCNEQVMQIVADSGMHYARTVKDTNSFKIPLNRFELNPTCHHNGDKLEELIEEFISTKATEKTPMLFYIWGHSWEFGGGDHDWVWFEELCKRLSKLDDVFYGTNAEVLNLV